MKNKKVDLIDIYIGEQIKEKRIAKRYSLADVASFLDTSKTTVFNYEKGIASMNISTIIDVCGFLGLDYIEVLENAKVKRYGNKV